MSALRDHDAGHLVGGLTAYYGSLTDDALTSVGGTVVGGTVAGTQAAQADAHTKLLALLASQYPGRPLPAEHAPGEGQVSCLLRS